MFPKIADRRLEDRCADASAASRACRRRAGLARGPLAHAPRARAATLLRDAAAVRADDAARPHLPAHAARSADETDVAAAVALFETAVDAGAARRPAARRRAGALARRPRSTGLADAPPERRAREATRSTPPAPAGRLAAQRVLAELDLGDRVAVHFVRAVGEAQRARAGVEVGEREVVATRRRRRAPASPSRSPGRPCSAPPP